MPDLREALRKAALLLAEAGVPSPRHDAEALAAHALGVDRRDLWRAIEIYADRDRRYGGAVDLADSPAQPSAE